MAYFTQEYLDFFADLGQPENNHKDWFHANKKRYEKFVKEPFKIFVQEIIDRMRADDPEVKMEPKDGIFRINRDIRFSKDKTPYKNHMSGMVSAGGKKNKSVPGLYFQFDTEHARIYSGAHVLEKDQLTRVREKIADNPKEFAALINDKTFKQYFGEIHGEKNKKLPKEFQEAAETQPLIYNKSFYYFNKLAPDTILDPKLADIMMDHWKAAKPLKAFFIQPVLG